MDDVLRDFAPPTDGRHLETAPSADNGRFLHEDSPLHPSDAELTIMPAGPDGIIGVVGRGFWDTALVTAHFADLGSHIARVRAPAMPVRVLVDLRGAPPQRPEVTTIVRQATLALYRPADRVAVVVESSLVKIQMRRILDCSKMTFFISIDAARTWLNAYNGQSAA